MTDYYNIYIATLHFVGDKVKQNIQRPRLEKLHSDLALTTRMRLDCSNDGIACSNPAWG
jgi:hypothetical protein